MRGVHAINSVPRRGDIFQWPAVQPWVPFWVTAVLFVVQLRCQLEHFVHGSAVYKLLYEHMYGTLAFKTAVPRNGRRRILWALRAATFSTVHFASPITRIVQTTEPPGHATVSNCRHLLA